LKGGWVSDKHPGFPMRPKRPETRRAVLPL